MRTRLAVVNRMLTKEAGTEREDQLIDVQQNLLLTRVNKLCDAERQSIVQRKDIIERKKKRVEDEDARQKLEKEEKIEEEKKKQLNEEKKKVEEDRLKRQAQEEEEIKKRKTEEQKELILKAFEKNNVAGASKLNKLRKVGPEANADQVIEEGKRIMIEAKQKAEIKRLKEWHGVHWLERAAREAETPLIRAQHLKKLDEQKNAYETRKQNTVEQMRKDYDEASSLKARLVRMVPYMDSFKERVLEERYKNAQMLRKAIHHVEEEETAKALMEQAGRGGVGAPSSGPSRGTSVAQPQATPDGEPAKPNAALESNNWRGGGATTSTSSASSPTAAEEPVKKWRPGHKKEEAAAPTSAAPAAAAPAAPAAAEPAAETKGKWVPPSQRNRAAGGAGGFPSSM